MVESSSDEILNGAQRVDVAFLVVGDPFRYSIASMYQHCAQTKSLYDSATTHTDLVLRARELSIPFQAIPNASIMSAIGNTGLQLYNYGQTVSMVFFTESWKPSSFYDRVKENTQIGLHTLILLDIKVKEQSLENLARGRKIYEPPRFMTVAQCAQQMLETESERKEGAYGEGSLAVGAARIGAKDQTMAAGTLKELCDIDLGPPLHSLVLLGKRTHELERDFIRAFAVNVETFDRSWEALSMKS
jgi:diphthine methyl ester synthase